MRSAATSLGLACLVIGCGASALPSAASRARRGGTCWVAEECGDVGPVASMAAVARGRDVLGHGIGEGTPIDAPLEGDCGGLAALAPELLRSTLRDRLRVHVPRSATEEAVYQMHPSGELERTGSLLRVAIDGRELAVVPRETHRSAGADLGSAVAAEHPGWRVTALAEGSVIAEPPRLHAHGAFVRLAEAYIADAEGWVLRATIVTAREAAERGGCGDVARRLAAGLERGERRFAGGPGEHTLLSGLRFVVPDGFRTSGRASCTDEHTVVQPIMVLGERGDPSGVLTLSRVDTYVPSDPTLPAMRPGWSRSESGLSESATLLLGPVPGGREHPRRHLRAEVGIVGRDRATVEQLQAIVATVSAWRVTEEDFAAAVREATAAEGLPPSAP